MQRYCREVRGEAEEGVHGGILSYLSADEGHTGRTRERKNVTQQSSSHQDWPSPLPFSFPGLRVPLQTTTSSSS